MNMLSQRAKVEGDFRMSQSSVEADALHLELAGGAHAATAPGALSPRGSRQMRRLGIVMCIASAVTTLLAASWIAVGF